MKKIISISTLLCIFALGLILVGCGEEAEKKEEKKTYKVGEEIVVKDGDKDAYKVTITKLSLTDARNEFDETKADRVVLIDYTYENINVEEGVYISELDMKVYDEDGTVLETYGAIDHKYPETISKGRTATASLPVALNSEGNKIEIELTNVLSTKVLAVVKGEI